MSDARPSFAEATRLWFKVGCLGFGGPAGQIALMMDQGAAVMKATLDRLRT